MHGMYTHEKHKNNAIALLPRRGLFNYNGSSDYCQMHFVTLVARMRSETRGTRKLDSANRREAARWFYMYDDTLLTTHKSFRTCPSTLHRCPRFYDHVATKLRDELSLTYNLEDRHRLANYRLLYLGRPRTTRIVAMTLQITSHPVRYVRIIVVDISHRKRCTLAKNVVVIRKEKTTEGLAT
ncbi:unnamed protein product [Xylocopa violacea]|uniref:Uncharacterized protein n=1 Tax=Xylocopa violacea TaxID=135666 RepID=A0ABP1NKM1_XYLVO